MLLFIHGVRITACGCQLSTVYACMLKLLLILGEAAVHAWEKLLQFWEQICLTTRKERKQQNPARWRSSRSIGRSSPRPHRRNTRSDSNHPLLRYAFDILLDVIDAPYDDAGKVGTMLRLLQFFGKAAPKPVAKPTVHSVMRCKVETAGLAN